MSCCFTARVRTLYVSGCSHNLSEVDRRCVSRTTAKMSSITISHLFVQILVQPVPVPPHDQRHEFHWTAGVRPCRPEGDQRGRPQLRDQPDGRRSSRRAVSVSNSAAAITSCRKCGGPLRSTKLTEHRGRGCVLRIMPFCITGIAVDAANSLVTLLESVDLIPCNFPCVMTECFSDGS